MVEREIELTTIVLYCCNYIQVITVTYYKPGQVLQVGVNIHVAFLIDILDFKTHSRGQMLLLVQWGKLKHKFISKVDRVVLVCWSHFQKEDVYTLPRLTEQKHPG